MGINFEEQIGETASSKPIHPKDIYESLDRSVGKGPLRQPVQEVLLDQWHKDHRDKEDLVLKLHTGEGKTLMGLLMLQSKINDTGKPCLYLCPNNYLVNQVCLQAEEFGVPVVQIESDDLPSEFIDGEKILVSSAQMLFNGRSRFGLDGDSTEIGTVLLDDAHACIDVIRGAATIVLEQGTQPYADLFQLFEEPLKSQGVGTFEEIKNKDGDAMLPVPYWDWISNENDVAAILAKHSAQKIKPVWFPWPLIKNNLKGCLCVFSGSHVEITPYMTPISKFHSFTSADSRIYMSATISDDSFFIKDFGVPKSVVESPLTYPDRKWSGEKMILIPSIIDHTLNREMIVNEFATPKERNFGTVAITPSFKKAEFWEKAGAVKADKKTINSEIEKLKSPNRNKNTLVIANRYDGIDLPDASCRILVLDSKPRAESLCDRMDAQTRKNSTAIKIKTAQVIEQGLGRSVRGEKDYSVIVLTGKDLIKEVRSKASREYFSPQTRKQIEIGIQVSNLAKSGMNATDKPLSVLISVINQCLQRDDGWKKYYKKAMDEIDNSQKFEVNELLMKEREAEEKFLIGDFRGAAASIQSLLDKFPAEESEQGWYLQTMARYLWGESKTESSHLQVTAHGKNRSLLCPKEGVTYQPVSITQQKRTENIVSFVKEHENFEELSLTVDEALGNLRFGINAEDFESALDTVGRFLGFECQRPDKQWKAGPDNLWALKDDVYLIAECKSKVLKTRESINKDESGQFSNHCSWFEKRYPGISYRKVLIIPTKKVKKSSGAGFTGSTEPAILRDRGLSRFVNDVRGFLSEFKPLDFQSLSEVKINELIENNGVTVDNILNNYVENVEYY